MKTRFLTAAALGVAAMTASAASAQDEASEWELSGNVGLFSEYRFRGIDFSDGDLALQGGMDFAHSSGFYVGTWGSNLAGFGDFGGSHVEVDVYGGYGGSLGGTGTFDVGVLWYLYPGTDDTDYVEFYGSVGAGLGPVEGTLGVAWAPDQGNLAEDNLYLYGELGTGIPNSPISLSAHLGYTEGSFGFGGAGYDDNYLDWSIGAALALPAPVEGLELGITYVDTDIDEAREVALGLGGAGAPLIADGTVVVSVAYSF